MRILIFFFSLLAAMLLCLSAIVCKLFIITAKDMPPLPQNEITVLHAERIAHTSEHIAPDVLPVEADAAVTESEAAMIQISTKEEVPGLSPAPSAKPPKYDSILPTSSFSDRDYVVTVTVNGEEIRLSLHDYLIGVLLAELPMGFCDDARYAQAVAARSYVVYCVERGRRLGPTSCAYFTEERAKTFYKHLYDAALAQAKTAVEATDGILITYGDEVCMAAFHAMSYAKTEASGEVWEMELPYLVPVETPEDIELGGMETEYTFTQRELSELLGGACALPMTLSYTDGGRVEEVIFASGDRYKGTYVRTALSLRATAISIVKQSQKGVTLRVLGYGHGVGMSQWGAQMMALDGYTWQEILLHYYRGAAFATLDSRIKP